MLDVSKSPSAKTKDSCNMLTVAELNKSPVVRRKIYDLETQLREIKGSHAQLKQTVFDLSNDKMRLQNALR